MNIDRIGGISYGKHGEYRIERINDLTRAWGNGVLFVCAGCVRMWSQNGKSTSLRIARTTIKKMIEAAK